MCQRMPMKYKIHLLHASNAGCFPLSSSMVSRDLGPSCVTPNEEVSSELGDGSSSVELERTNDEDDHAFQTSTPHKHSLATVFISH